MSKPFYALKDAKLMGEFACSLAKRLDVRITAVMAGEPPNISIYFGSSDKVSEEEMVSFLKILGEKVSEMSEEIKNGTIQPQDCDGSILLKSDIKHPEDDGFSFPV